MLSQTGLSFLVAQMVKNLPAMWETWVQSLGWEDHLEEGMATHSSILAWRRISPADCSPGGHRELDTTQPLNTDRAGGVAAKRRAFESPLWSASLRHPRRSRDDDFQMAVGSSWPNSTGHVVLST